MSYDTEFYGEFVLSRPATRDETILVNHISENIHFQRYRDFPSSFCGWVITSDGRALKWDHGDNFTEYIEWVQFLIRNIFEPRGIKLTGTVEWKGEELSDIGKIIIVQNKIKVYDAEVKFVKRQL